jgi:DNA-binding response OmpR family regulator
MAVTPPIFHLFFRRRRMSVTSISANPTESGARRRVLIVENDGDTLKVLTRVLQRDGFEVLTAEDCETAWNAAKTIETLNLAVGDVGLSDGDGRRLLGELKIKFGCPTLALSGYTRDQAQGMLGNPPADSCGRVEVAQVGPDVWLVKPVNLADFRRVVGTLTGAA